MSKKLSNRDYEIVETEVKETGPTYYLEEDISIDEKYVKNKSLIRMDMNIVQFPIFSKNTKRKKNEVTTYYFNKNRDTYIVVKPSAGELIPGEAEEKIFIALMKLLKEKGMEQEFFVSAKEIKDAAKINAGNYTTEIKKALLRLSETNYNFKNTMYSNEHAAILKDEISTPILTFRAKKLSLRENSHLRNEFEDGRIKEVYWIRISDHFYKNIVKRGYLVYDSNILLDINSSVSRTLYMLLEKIRFDEVYVRESVFALIKKIPLKFEKKSLPMTIKTLEKAFDELKRKNLIKDFNFVKETTWQEADVEVFYSEKHNEIKTSRFNGDNSEVKKIYSDLQISYTEKTNIENKAEEYELKQELNTLVTDEIIENILNQLPEKARNLKSMPVTIEKSIKKYGIKKVISVVNYMKSQKKIEKIKSYFIKALENDWLEENEDVTQLEKEKKIVKENEKIEQISLEISKENEDDNLLYDKYLGLVSLEKDKIEELVKESYVKKAGSNNKIVMMAFAQAKRKLIIEYLKSTKYFDSKNEAIPKIEELKTNETEKELVNIEREFNDTLDFKFQVFENLNNKFSLDFIKNVLDFIQIENVFIGEREGYKIDLRYNNGIGKIYIKKCDNKEE